MTCRPMTCRPVRRSLATLGTIILVLWSVAAIAQDPPATDIWLLHIEPGDELTEGVPRLASASNVTDRAGYDNQPFFVPGKDAFLYTAIVDGQADIYLYDLSKGASRRLTETDQSEYSPTPLVGGGGFSVVRVEDDGRQRLWKFFMDGQKPSLLLADVEPVGYHAWGDDGELVLFVLGEPHQLHRAKLGQPGSRSVASDIGRGLSRIPEQDAVSFIHQAGDDGGWVKRLDLASGEIEPLIATLPGREDVAWAPDGTLWGADGGKVYRWCPFCGSRWQLVADLEASHGLKDITRMTIDSQGKRLALVAARQHVVSGPEQE